MARINEGYEIVASIPTSNRHEIVIGHAISPRTPAQYVCWNCTDGDNYHNGGYATTYRQALAVVAERINRQYEYLPTEAPARDPGINNRLETIAMLVDSFEEFLEEKGIDLENPERDEDPCGSLIYGTDYGILSDKIETVLINIGVLDGE